MTSPQAKALENQFRLMRCETENSEFDLRQERSNTVDAHELCGVPDGITFVDDELAGMPTIRAVPDQDSGEFNIVLLHGGAFCLMSARTHHRFAGYIARACRAEVLVPDYGLAPEFPFPVALVQCAEALRAAQQRHEGQLTALIGDSAGGGLALSTLLWTRDNHRLAPFGAVLMAPWLDLTLSSPSVKSAADSDVILAETNLRAAAGLYLSGENARDPLASPVFGDFRGLPPLYVQVSENDLLRDDGLRLKDAYAKQDLKLECDLCSGMLHSFQFFAGRIPEAEAAIDRSAQFLRKVLDRVP